MNLCVLIVVCEWACSAGQAHFLNYLLMIALPQHLQEELYTFFNRYNYPTLSMAIKDLLLFYIAQKHREGFSQIISENIEALIELTELLDLAIEEMTEE